MNRFEPSAHTPLSETEWIARENESERADMRRELALEAADAPLTDQECAERDAWFELNRARAHASYASAAQAWAASELDDEGLHDAKQSAESMGYYPAALPAKPKPIKREVELFSMLAETGCTEAEANAFVKKIA